MNTTAGLALVDWLIIILYAASTIFLGWYYGRKQKSTKDYELEKAIARLPDSYREVVLLRFYANLSCSQIAENLEMPIGTVTKQLSRAYAKLRQLLEKQKNEERRLT